jgi:hypothetical protein
MDRHGERSRLAKRRTTMVSDLRWPTAGWRLTACYTADLALGAVAAVDALVLSCLRPAEPIPTTPTVKGW